MIIFTKRVIISLIISTLLVSAAINYKNHMSIIILPLDKFASIFYSFNNHLFNIDIIYLFLFLIMLGVLSEILITTGATKAFQEWIKPKTNNSKIIESVIMIFGMIYARFSIF